MLRQIHVFHKGEMVFSHNLALGLNADDLANIIPVIKSNLDAPISGKIFQRSIGEFQIYNSGEGSTSFLFVGDDDISYIENILNKIMKKFMGLFPNPKSIESNGSRKLEFIEFLYTQQRALHSKIAIIGPIKSGKTTLYNMLKASEEKKIMDFAKTSSFEIEDLSFEIWDFILPENYSNLWFKFVAGADLIILVFDASNYNLKLIHHFVNIKKTDAPSSRFLIIANKNDIISSDEDIKLMKNEVGLLNIHELSLISPQGRSTLINLIIETLRLKKPLPPDYGDFIDKAIKFEENGNLTEAIIKYRDIITIARKHQDSNTLSSFEEKLELLEQQREEQRILEKEAIRRQKFAVPAKVGFHKKPSVKSLPSVKPLPGDKWAPHIQPVSPSKGSTLKRKEIEEQPRPLDKEEIKISLVKTLIQNAEYDKALLILIKEKGSSLSPKLSKEFVKKLQMTLDKSLSLFDLQIAAEIFRKAEKGN